MVYLICEIILGALDIAWLTRESEWEFTLNAIYASLTILMTIAYLFFARGFIALSNVFENKLLRISCYMLIVAMGGVAILDITSLGTQDIQTLWLPYSVASIVFGALSIAFGVALIRLQDGMGELSRIAGLLEIVTGCLLITVILFFITYIIIIPAVVIEILVLYRGYEYLSRTSSAQSSV